jgi:hypothetical protein
VGGHSAQRLFVVPRVGVTLRNPGPQWPATALRDLRPDGPNLVRRELLGQHRAVR